MKFHFLISFFFLLNLMACHKDSVDEIQTNTVRYVLSPDSDKFVADLIGKVYDEEKKPVIDAIVKYEDLVTITDQNGDFLFENANLDKKGSYVRVEKEGYFFGSDLTYPTDSINETNIQLLNIRNTRNFDSTSGATMDIDQGGSITFDPSSIVSENGSTYTDIVYVTALRLAANDPDLHDKMPGGLIGRDDSGEKKALATLGMVAVEIQDAAGNKLDLAPGAKSKIKFPVLPEDLDAAPATIPLWHFDEGEGIWIEKEEAILVGTDYHGLVSHLGFWNCGIKLN